MSDPAADIIGALTPVVVTNHAALTEPRAVGAFLRTIDVYRGELVTQLALRILPLVFLRSSELRFAEWWEIDWDEKLWRVPARRLNGRGMKMKEAHLVPLSRQTLELLRELHTLTSNRRFMFPQMRKDVRPLSENTINGAFRGGSADLHGAGDRPRNEIERQRDFIDGVCRALRARISPTSRLGEICRLARLYRQVSQLQTAKYMGCSQCHVSLLETGQGPVMSYPPLMAAVGIDQNCAMQLVISAHRDETDVGLLLLAGHEFVRPKPIVRRGLDAKKARERAEDILLRRAAGELFRSIGGAWGISGTRARQIWVGATECSSKHARLGQRG